MLLERLDCAFIRMAEASWRSLLLEGDEVPQIFEMERRAGARDNRNKRKIHFWKAQTSSSVSNSFDDSEQPNGP